MSRVTDALDGAVMVIVLAAHNCPIASSYVTAGATTPATRTPAGTSAVTTPLIPTMGDTQQMDSNTLQLVLDAFGIVAMPLPVRTPPIVWQFDAPVTIKYKPAVDITNEYLHIQWKDSPLFGPNGNVVVPIKTTIGIDIEVEFAAHPMAQAINGGPGWRVVMLAEAQLAHVDTPLHTQLNDSHVTENRVQIVTWQPRRDVCSVLCIDDLKENELGALVGAYGGQMWIVRPQEEVNRARLRSALIQEEEALHIVCCSNGGKKLEKKEDKRRTERVVRRWTKFITAIMARQLVAAVHELTTYRIKNPVFPQDMFALRGDTIADMLHNRWEVAVAHYA